MSDAINSSSSFVSPDVNDRFLSYEEKLSQDLSWAMDEGSRHFDEKSAVHETLRRICQRLNALKIPYAIAGGMEMVQDWISLLGIGRVAAVMMRGTTIGVEAEINAFHLIAEPSRGPAL